MSKVITPAVVLGYNADDTRNFLLDTDLAGGFRIRRKSDGSGGLLATFDAAGNLQLGAASNANAGRMVLDVAKPATGTAVEFLNVPAWAKKITVACNAISTNGSSNPILQLGTSAGFNTNGYTAYAGGVVFSPGGIGVGYGTAPASTANSVTTFVHMGGNLWIGTTHIFYTGGASNGGGIVQLSGVLDRLRLQAYNGTDQLDGGSVNVLYEG
jgi:hypothetical protein